MKALRRPVQPTHEHEFEAAPGLPEALPDGERVLWQGKPAWRLLAVQAFHVRALVFYFTALVVLRAGFALADGAGTLAALRAAAPLALMFAFALAMLVLVAWLSARTTCYTLTNRRLVMRVGIVLTLTFNLPLKRLSGAGLSLHGATGSGDIPVQLAAPDKIAFVHLWPHARPWRMARPEPMLRCIPGASAVAEALRAAWVRENVALVPAPGTAVAPSTATSTATPVATATAVAPDGSAPVGALPLPA